MIVRIQNCFRERWRIESAAEESTALSCFLEKKRRKSGCAFLALDFQRTGAPSVLANLATALFLEFHRRESDRGSPYRHCHRRFSQQAHPLAGRQIESSRRLRKLLV